MLTPQCGSQPHPSLDAGVLIACGVGADGHRDVLGCSVSLSEAEVHWRSFLASLKDRGLHGIQLIVSDAHEGLRAARQAVFPSVPWQLRCSLPVVSALKLATWAEENLPEGFTVFSLPPSHRRRLRTTNLVERLNEEIRRRTRVARLFPNEASCLRLVSAVLMEIAEDWQTADKRYLAFED
jgi:transposase-like protein